MELIDSVFFSQLIMNFETHLENIFKQLELPGFSVEGWRRCGEQFLSIWKIY